jgi:CheY-like chemotaxis protein
LLRVLVVEDERKITPVLAEALQADHYDVVVAGNGKEGFFRASADVFDLLVLDIMLPGRSGLAILQALRQRHIHTPVLILTAPDGVDDRVIGLDLGAEDYFVNRLRARTARADPRAAPSRIATWPVTAAACFPMALDETNQRLFIGCRRPANVLVFDTTTGKQVSAFEIVGDTDDLFYDAARKRRHVIGGEGFLDAIEKPSVSQFVRIAHLPTAAGARTGLFTPDHRRLYLAVPHRDSQRAEIRVYDVH